MSKVIPFPIKKRIPKEIRDLKELSDAMDSLIREAVLNKNLPPYEVAGVLAHRLGTLLKNIDKKDQLWKVCEGLLKQQALIK